MFYSKICDETAAHKLGAVIALSWAKTRSCDGIQGGFAAISAEFIA